MTTKQKFSIVSLGCARNLVDSEVMAGLLQKNNYEIVSEPGDADIVMVNTCGFIGAAKEESIDTIVEMGRLKESGQAKEIGGRRLSLATLSHRTRGGTLRSRSIHRHRRSAAHRRDPARA